MPPLVTIIFAGVFIAIVGAYWGFVLVPESRGKAVLRRRLKSKGPTGPRVRLLKPPDVLSRIGSLDSILRKLGGLFQPLKTTIDQAGLQITVASFLVISILAGLSGAFAAWLYTGVWWLAAIGGAVAALLPRLILIQLRIRRIRAFEEQFPEAIELIARAMRAGHAFTTGIKMAADELPAPTGTEFKVLYEQQNYGAQMPDALKAFADRVPSLDARFFVTAVLTQRETGGNLAEVLDRLAAVMRERFRIKREVRVKSAHGRITAYVLAGLPPSLAFIMLFNNPEQFRLLITDPLGIRMVIVAVALQVVGTLIVRKLVDIQY